jgi:uncharacterized coiled-coil DUF342 family protein
MRELLDEINVLSKEKRDLLDRRRLLIMKKRVISAEIRDKLMPLARELRLERDVINEKVRENKNKREDVSSRIKQILASLKKIEGEAKEHRDARAAGFLRKLVEALDFKFQTEPVEFEKERQLLKRIDSIKAELRKAVHREELLKQAEGLESQLDGLRKEQEAFHMLVVSTAKGSDEVHARLKGVIERINGLRKKEQPFSDRISEVDARLSEINKALDEKRLKVEAIRSEIESKKEQAEKQELRKRVDEVKKKFAEKRKLTTEDILILQAEEKI